MIWIIFKQTLGSFCPFSTKVRNFITAFLLGKHNKDFPSNRSSLDGLTNELVSERSCNQPNLNLSYWKTMHKVYLQKPTSSLEQQMKKKIVNNLPPRWRILNMAKSLNFEVSKEKFCVLNEIWFITRRNG